METTQRVIDRLRLVGGDLSLDFVNTRSGPADGPPELEGLTAYDDVVAWATRVGVLSKAQAAKLRRIAASDTGAAARAIGEALSVRETLSSVLVSLARGTGSRSAGRQRGGAAGLGGCGGGPAHPRQRRRGIRLDLEPRDRAPGSVVAGRLRRRGAAAQPHAGAAEGVRWLQLRLPR